MAKGSGSLRVSAWGDNLYFRNGYRVEYYQLTDKQKKLVNSINSRIKNALISKIEGNSTSKEIGDGKKIEVVYTKSGITHFCRDAMIVLSGKYFSEESMMRIDEIFSKSKYVPTSNLLKKERKDGRSLWFTYQDADGRGVYFKVAYNSSRKLYELYSIVDKIE